MLFIGSVIRWGVFLWTNRKELSKEIIVKLKMAGSSKKKIKKQKQPHPTKKSESYNHYK